MIAVEATIEEFEQGAWVADLVSLEEFDGSFDLGDVTWTGAKVSSNKEGDRNYTRVVGGAGKLSAVLEDKYYDGSVTLQAAVQDICREAKSETFGGAVAGVQLTTYERLKGPAYTALDALASALAMMWWVGRDGGVNVQLARPVAALADGLRVAVDANSVTLADPKGVELGGTYGDDAPQPIRHIRWMFSNATLKAQIYFVPFLFRAPVQTSYDCLYNAAVDKDNGDGTIDVIAAARFGVTKVPLFCGVPGSKVKVKGGEQVMLGFFGGDPQKPYAVAMAQDTSAAKKVGRVGDKVTVTIPAGSFLVSCSGTPAVGVTNVNPVDVDGTIKAGTERLMVGD